RVSTSTTPPSAPRARSSQRNQKRACPGVPKRNSSRSESSVIRPKSIATVVCDFVVSGPGSSIPALTSVIQASVLTGGISETELTSVVFPTPNPPATTIFAEIVSAPGSGSASCGEAFESIEDPLQHVCVVLVRVCRRVDEHCPAVREIPDKHPDHAQR